MIGKLSDINWASKIVKITNSIYDIYTRLLELENQGQKNTEEYDSLLSTLIITTEKEEELYTLLKGNYNTFLMHFNHFEGIENLNTKEIKDDVLRRIHYKLNEINDFYKSQKLSKLSNSKGQDTTNFKLMIILSAIFKDYMNAVLYFLQKEINGKEDYLKRNLTLIKYLHSFLYPVNEISILENNFRIPEYIYYTSQFIADILEIPIEEFNALKSQKAIQVIMGETYSLLEIKDKDYSDLDIELETTLMMCRIKACLLLLSDKEVEALKTSFIEATNEEEHSHYKAGRQLIIKCFNQNKFDRKKVYEVSGPKRS